MNFIKKALVGGIVSAVTIFSLVSSPSFAAGASGATSEGRITLTPGASETPVDPLYPSEPPGETGNTGPLTIDNITPIEFGSYEITGQNFMAIATTTNPNIQVTDARGSGAGWTLQVASSPFVDGTKTLKGAVLTLPIGLAATSPGNVSAAPQLNSATLDTSTGAAVNLMTAQADQGMGTWVNVLDPNSINLNIPAGNFSGEYKATLMWTLVDAPQ